MLKIIHLSIDILVFAEIVDPRS